MMEEKGCGRQGRASQSVTFRLWKSLRFAARFFWDVAQGEELVVEERGLVLVQLHFGDAVVELFASLFHFRELVFRLLLVVDVDFGETLASLCQGAEECEVGGDPSCLRASLSGNGLRQSGICFLFFVS
jgi:hypothetical protein